MQGRWVGRGGRGRCGAQVIPGCINRPNRNNAGLGVHAPACLRAPRGITKAILSVRCMEVGVGIVQALCVKGAVQVAGVVGAVGCCAQ